jgi:hypothetical protein
MDVSAILRRHDGMVSDRATFEQHWEEAAERVLPRQSVFTGQRQQGDKRTEKIFDSTAPLALTRFAAAMESISTPRAEKWHRLSPEHPLKEDGEAKRWLEEITDQLFRVRYSPSSNFASQAHEAYMALGCFGTAVIFVDEDPGRGIRYRHLHMSEIYMGLSFDGRVDTIHRKFQLTARQALQQFGEKALPAKIREAAEKTPDSQWQFLHCVYPASEVKSWRVGREAMPWASVYIAIDSREQVGEPGGYYEFPYMIMRYTVAPGETYGRSPAMDALPDVKMLNEMEKTMLRAAHRQVDPPLLTADDGVLAPFQIVPGRLIPGGIGEDGHARVQALQSGANLPLSLEISNQRRRTINEHFLVTLFQILEQDRTNMTATEVMQRAQEKGALLAPAAGRMQAEFLGPLIQREVGILARAGALPPPPDSWMEAGGDYQIEYLSEMSRAQRAGEAVGIMRSIEGLSPLAQFDPSVLDRINGSEAAKVVLEANGVPSKAIRSDAEVEAMRQGRAQAEQAAQTLQGASVASGAAKNMAQAAAMAGIPGGALLGNA